jgi:hypothetical protein
MIHLIELSGLQFVKAYRKARRYFRIRSINTDYPVVLGATGKTFEQTKRRPTLAINDSMQMTESTLERVRENIVYLRNYR